VVIGVTGAAVGWRQPLLALALLSATFCRLLLTPRIAQVTRAKIVMLRLAKVRLAQMV